MQLALEPALLHAREVEREFDILSRAGFDGVLVHDGWTIVRANEKCAVLFGCENADDIVGRDIAEFMAPETGPLILAHAVTSTDRRFHTTVVKRNGQRLPAELCEISSGVSTLRIVAIRDLSERRMREKMRTSREIRNRMLAQVVFDGICVHKHGKLIEVNDAIARMTGWSVEELTGMSGELLVRADERANVLEHIRRGDSRVYESFFLRKDGTSFAVELCGTPLPDGERITAVRDISKRKEAESALLASEDRYRDLVENSQDLIGTHDLEGGILSANPAVGRALNRPVEDLPGRNLMAFLEAGTDLDFAEYVNVLQQERTASGVVSITAGHHGKTLWEYRSTLRTDGVTRPIARVLARDVTEREKSLAAVRHSEEHFRSIIENSPDLIAIIERDSTIRYHSPSIERVLGIACDSVVGTSFLNFVHPDDAQRASEFLERQIAQPGANRMIELRLHHQRGSYRSFEVVARNLTSAGAVTAIQTNARDITDRKRLEAQLAQANRLSSLGRLAATVAHEFNNVLMGIQPFTELMLRPNASPSVISRGALHISNSVQRGKRIALDILRFTQPALPVTARVDVGEWWEGFAPEAEKVVGNIVRVVAKIDYRGTCVVADKEQLSQVMANLVSNARDAMPRGGTLTVKAVRPEPDAVFTFGVVSNPERFIHISVGDTGQGISPAVLLQIFEPLFTTKESGGTGLGLAVAHQILTQHGGYIFAESEVGHGATFHLFVPVGLAPCDEAACDTPDPVLSPAGRTLLMVEDEQPIVDGITALLDCEGMKVVSVGTGEAAVGAVARFHPDVVLLDFGLPDMDGSEVFARLRKANPDLAVIFATGHGDRRAIHDGMGDLRTRFLQKPFEIAALLEMIAELRREGAVR